MEADDEDKSVQTNFGNQIKRLLEFQYQQKQIEYRLKYEEAKKQLRKTKKRLKRSLEQLKAIRQNGAQGISRTALLLHQTRGWQQGPQMWHPDRIMQVFLLKQRTQDLQQKINMLEDALRNEKVSNDANIQDLIAQRERIRQLEAKLHYYWDQGLKISDQHEKQKSQVNRLMIELGEAGKRFYIEKKSLLNQVQRLNQQRQAAKARFAQSSMLISELMNQSRVQTLLYDQKQAELEKAYKENKKLVDNLYNQERKASRNQDIAQFQRKQHEKQLQRLQQVRKQMYFNYQSELSDLKTKFQRQQNETDKLKNQLKDLAEAFKEQQLKKTSLQYKLKDQIETRQKIQSRLRQKQDQNQNIKLKRRQLTIQLKQTRLQAQQKEQQNIRDVRKIRELSFEKQTMAKKLSQIVAKYQILQQKYLKGEQNYQDTKRTKQRLQFEMAIHQKKIKQVNQEKESLQARLLDLSKAYQIQKGQVKLKEGVIKEFNEIAAQIEKKGQKSAQQLQKLRESIKQLQKQHVKDVVKMQQQAKTIHKSFQQLAQIGQKLKQRNRLFAAKQQEFQDVVRELIMIKQQNKGILQSRQILTDQLYTTRQQKKLLQQELSNYTKLLKASQTKVSQQNQHINAILKERAIAYQDLERSQRKRQALVSALQSIQQQRQIQREQLNARLAAQTAQSGHVVDQLTQQIQNIKKQFKEKLAASQSELDRNNVTLQREKQQYNDKLNRLIKERQKAYQQLFQDKKHNQEQTTFFTRKIRDIEESLQLLRRQMIQKDQIIAKKRVKNIQQQNKLNEIEIKLKEQRNNYIQAVFASQRLNDSRLTQWMGKIKQIQEKLQLSYRQRNTEKEKYQQKFQKMHKQMEQISQNGLIERKQLIEKYERQIQDIYRSYLSDEHQPLQKEGQSKFRRHQEADNTGQVGRQLEPLYMYGNTYVTMNLKQDNNLWIGLSVKKNDSEFHTKNCIWLKMDETVNIQTAFTSLKNQDFNDQVKVVYFINANLAMIRDLYREKQYYSLRMMKYYRGEPVATKNGFNLRPIQMERVITRLKYIY